MNRTHFQREQLTQGHQQSVCSTRALFCELIANRILRRFYEDNTGAQGLLLLSQILVGGFDPFQGAPADVVAESSQLSWTIQMRSGYRRKLPALEIAIISESKVFLSVSKLYKLTKIPLSDFRVNRQVQISFRLVHNPFLPEEQDTNVEILRSHQLASTYWTSPPSLTLHCLRARYIPGLRPDCFIKHTRWALLTPHCV